MNSIFIGIRFIIVRIINQIIQTDYRKAQALPLPLGP